MNHNLNTTLTMKSLKYSLAISMALGAFAHEAEACGYTTYLPAGYYMYRVVDDTLPAHDISFAEENCLQWQQLTSEEIPLDHIHQVVYDMPLWQFMMLYDDSDGYFWTDNHFEQYIKYHDREVMDFLLLAKLNEELRAAHSSPWYYPSMRVEKYGYTLERIAEIAVESDAPRMRDRYLLQAIRALFTLGRYDECMKLWTEEAEKLPKDNVMRKLILPYIAGVECRLGNYESAMEFYAKIGDIDSMFMCARMGGYVLSMADAIAIAYRNCPDNPRIIEKLQRYVRDGENAYGGYGLEEEPRRLDPERRRMRNYAIEFASAEDAQHPAMWYYTAAMLYDMDNEPEEADKMLALAEQSEGSDFIHESIKVLRINVDARLKPYDRAYDKLLFEQLQWLDAKIRENIDEEVIERTASDGYLDRCVSYYYWNDMMRRILLAEVCPRMIDRGRGARALQLANMADNYLRSLVGYVSEYVCSKGTNYCEDYETMTLEEYRHSSELHNYIDFSNDFFDMADVIDIEELVKYADVLEHPKGKFDEFLNARGYTDMDYIYDIIGTRYLRTMQYAKAEEYFQRMNSGYGYRLNVRLYNNPFEIEPTPYYAYGADFRYHFAREMAFMERYIATMEDSNRKAWMMLRYAIGMRNSFMECWPLTQYSYGYVGHRRCSGWWYSKEAKGSIKHANNLIAEAIATFTDDEMAACVQYELSNFKTVATSYRHTRYGQIVLSSCDRLRDYRREFVK